MIHSKIHVNLKLRCNMICTVAAAALVIIIIITNIIILQGPTKKK